MDGPSSARREEHGPRGLSVCESPRGEGAPSLSVGNTGCWPQSLEQVS